MGKPSKSGQKQYKHRFSPNNPLVITRIHIVGRPSYPSRVTEVARGDRLKELLIIAHLFTADEIIITIKGHVHRIDRSRESEMEMHPHT